MASKEDGLDSHLLKRFDILKRIGKGAYGIVWKVVEKDTGRTMALKRCFDAFHNSTDAQRTFREIMFLIALNGHENIVRLMSVMKADSHLDIYVVFDFMQSDLQHVIYNGLLQPIHTEYITYQVLKALKYCHSGGILHRDLKPANVLLNPNCHVRICDFGLARSTFVEDPKYDPVHPNFTDYVATRWYRAPELLLTATSYGEGVDMWGVGCILGEMVAGKPILKGKSTLDQIEKIIELTGKPTEADLRPIVSSSKYAKDYLSQLSPTRTIPSTSVLFLLKAPPKCKNFILNHLKFNPDKRPTAEMALEEPFVEKFHLQEPEPTCDRLIRMPIADTTKLKAADYRNQIYAFVQQHLKASREDSSIEGQDTVSPKASPRLTGRSTPSRKSVRDDHRQPLAAWTSGSGVDAPPPTPH